MNANTQMTLGGSQVENIAARAQTHTALGRINLAAIRNDLDELLQEIGKTPEFSTYTRHDISHIDAMLDLTDWLIPPETMTRLTVADALVLTISIYVHDLGLLVTKSEFDERHKSRFPEFKTSVMTGASGKAVDFRERADQLEADELEHFLYEEFVRTHHAERIERWIHGAPHRDLGVSDEAATLVQKAVGGLNDIVKNDIALIARSHHDDDLNDLTKYKPHRAYSPAEQDAANIQYACLILRSADLLHMTLDRTPAVQYLLATPTDPMGQREWNKQMTIRAVLPLPSEADDAATKIDVHATFTNPDGFFALMEFLDYCESQLAQNEKWAREAAEANISARGYAFLRTSFHRDNIETRGFDPRQLLFEFDHKRVLDLLTGHMLYNDGSVAIRELVQNSLDSVRLAQHQGILQSVPKIPEVHISYNTSTRMLSIRDRGTGMTKEVIETHFLRVGSSSYQTKKFRDENPSFTSISRFGIGVLSAFMIADEIRVATKAAKQPAGHEIVLRSVHGRYLIKQLVDGSESANTIGEHGTEITLRLRASSVLNESMPVILTKWIVIPGCQVTLKVDDEPETTIGHASAKEHLKEVLETLHAPEKIDIYAFSASGIEVAVARRWNDFYQEWEVIDRTAKDSDFQRSGGQGDVAGANFAGVLIQGVRVSEEVPGFSTSGPLVLVNAHGPNAPTTNVARTHLESGDPLDSIIGGTYAGLIESIVSQVGDLTSRVSERFALSEAAHLYRDATAFRRGGVVRRSDLADVELMKNPLFAAELNGEHLRVSAGKLLESGFWLMSGPAIDDAVKFLEWAPSKNSSIPLLKSSGLLTMDLPDDVPVLSDSRSLTSYNSLLWRSFEPVHLVALEEASSLLIRFARRTGRWGSEPRNSTDYNSAWVSLYQKAEDRSRPLRDSYNRNFENSFALTSDITLDSLDSYSGVVLRGSRLFLPGSVPAGIFSRIWPRFKAGDPAAAGELASLVWVLDMLGASSNRVSNLRQLTEEMMTDWFEVGDRADWSEKESILEIFGLSTIVRFGRPTVAGDVAAKADARHFTGGVIGPEGI